MNDVGNSPGIMDVLVKGETIMSKARRTKHCSRARQAWSKDEIKTLKKIFRNMTTIDVAYEMGRTIGSVQGKASVLGSPKPVNI